jgi:signal transduction histidine kinase
MKIRKRLTLQFVAIVILINVISSIFIYYFSSNYRYEEFYGRLYAKANNTAKLLIKFDEINSELLRKIERGAPGRLPNEKIVIYNDSMRVIFSTDEKNELIIDEPLIQKIRNEGELRFIQDKFEALGFLFSDGKEKFIVVAAAVDIFGKSKIKNLAIVLSAVFGASCLLSFALGWVYSGRALMPISKMVDEVNEITISSLNLRLDEGNRTDEIAKLAETFNGMLKRIESAYILQKKFIANASHEMRTPLTAMKGQLEVTLMQERNSEEYRKVILSVLDDIKNLNNVSNNLLMMAQAESGAISSFVPLRIDELLWQTRTALLNVNKEYSIFVKIDDSIEDEKKLIVDGNEQLLRAVLINLLDNACKYSEDKSVEVLIKSENQNLKISFTDRGIGIPKDELKDIFEPFHRAKNSFSVKGHGIGLSLVESILKMHNATIQVSSVLNKGSVFTVRFPLH